MNYREELISFTETAIKIELLITSHEDLLQQLYLKELTIINLHLKFLYQRESFLPKSEVKMLFEKRLITYSSDHLAFTGSGITPITTVKQFEEIVLNYLGIDCSSKYLPI